MRIALAQINPTVGDVAGNTERIVDAILRAKASAASLVIFPELCTIGYPPKDLLLKDSVIQSCAAAVDRIAAECRGITAIVGLPYRSNVLKGLPLHNAAAICSEGKVLHLHFKHLLPTYDIFDESRYFEPGPAVDLTELGGVKLGVSVCEDLWNDEEVFSRQLYHDNPIQSLAGMGAQVFINCSASPFVVRKHAFRLKLLQHTAKKYALPIVYVNQVGGNDDLVFDGNSCVVGADGTLLAHAKDFEEDLLLMDLSFPSNSLTDVLLTGHELLDSVNLNALRARAATYARDNLRGRTITNRNTNARITIAGTAVKKMVSGPTTLDKLRTIPALPRLLEVAEYAGAEPDRRNRNTIRAIHHYRWTLAIAGRGFNVNLVVRETTNGDFFYDHNLSGIKESAGISGEAAKPRSLRPTADQSIIASTTDTIETTHRVLQRLETPRSGIASIHAALVLGLRDYCRKCGFDEVVLGLSGGVDSAVCACIAADALGPGRVTGVAMPSRYSSTGSLADANRLAQNLGIRYQVIPITDAHESMERTLATSFRGTAPGAAEENVQARLRGIILMGLSNKFGHLLVTTGNKSELAVGYCTLYGDMAGGLALVSDVPKTVVYELARWINANRGNPIPESSITKPPSAELRPNQTDQDTLPPYEVLDEIVERYVEREQSVGGIVKETGLTESLVKRIVGMIDRNEYKRKQMPPGLKVTGRAFGSGRRMPIAQRWTGG